MAKRNKARDIKRHAAKRARQRLGMGRRDLSKMRKMIQRGQSIPVEKQSNRITVHKLFYDETDIIAVYDKNRNLIVTVWEA